MRFTRFGRLLASALAVATIAFPLNSYLFAATDASMMGRVTGADGLAPRTGVVVALVDAKGNAISRSAPTDARGSFAIAGAPAGNYRVLVETGNGAYLASNGVALKAGENGPVSLALRPNAQGEPTTPPADAPVQATSGGLAPWAKWLIVGGIVVGGAIIVGSLNDDDEASSF